MSSEASGPCPPDSELMKAWTKYQATDDFSNTLYWAKAETRMREKRAKELGVMPEANRESPEMREQRVIGSLWASFMAGFAAAGGKVSF